MRVLELPTDCNDVCDGLVWLCVCDGGGDDLNV